MNAEWDRLQQRLSFLETLVARSKQDLEARMARGFIAVQKRDLPAVPTTPAEVTIPAGTQEEIQALFDAERDALQVALREAAPRQLHRTLRTLRWAVRMGLVLFALLLIALAAIHLHFREIFRARTPTAFQIEMMRLGYETYRQQALEGGDHVGPRQ